MLLPSCLVLPSCFHSATQRHVGPASRSQGRALPVPRQRDTAAVTDGRPALKAEQTGAWAGNLLFTVQTWGETRVVLACRYDGVIPSVREKITQIK